MMILLALILFYVATPAAHAGDRPPTGIIANDSGLPATLPLQVMTPRGRDFAVMLADPATGDPSISGYIRGGDFFRLLVPPGEFALTILYGQDWRGFQDGFASDAGRITLDGPLRFGITGGVRRNGHQIVLRDDNGTIALDRIDDQTICDTAMFDSEVREYPERGSLRDSVILPPDRTRLRYLDLTYDRYARLCD